MMLVRPVQRSDLPALAALAEGAPRGVHGLPRTPEAISSALDVSLASFDASVAMPGAQSYFLALEDTDDGSLAGAAMIHAVAGATRPFIAFRYELTSQFVAETETGHRAESLTLCRDLNTFSQVAGLTMRDADYVGAHAALLSRARLMYAAMEPHRFGENFFAILPGVYGEDGESPFWNAIGKKYFDMTPFDAEILVDSTRQRSLVEALMPDFSVTVASLPEAGRDVLGQSPAAGGKPVRRLLKEGLQGGEYIDFYDGGAIFHAHQRSVRSIAASMRRTVVPLTEPAGPDDEAVTYLISTLVDNRFRALLAACPSVTQSEQVALPAEVMQALGVTAGDVILCVAL